MTDTGTTAIFSDFDYAWVSVQDVLGTFPSVRHVQKTKLQQFSFDLTIVAFAIRCGYLFDAFGLRDKRTTLKDILAQVLTKLRNMLPVYKAITLIHDPASDQLFFISVPRLKTYYELQSDCLNESLLTWVSFVGLQGSTAKVCSPPIGLSTVFRTVTVDVNAQGTPPVVVCLPEPEADQRSMGDMVAFAACILEFPVAYVPDVLHAGPFLAGVPLDVYECVLVPLAGGIAQTPDSHEARTLIKFSCPRIIGMDVPELAPERVIERLSAHFAEGVRRTTCRTFVVHHSVETLDRVAL